MSRAIGEWAPSFILRCPECDAMAVWLWHGSPRMPGESMEWCSACGWEG